MADTRALATLIDSTTSKIQQLQQAFAELESYRAISLNVKWKELEEHFRGLEMSLKKRFTELQDQENEYKTKASEAREALENQNAIVIVKEQASLEKLQIKRDSAVSFIGVARENYNKSPVGIADFMTIFSVPGIMDENNNVTSNEVASENQSPALSDVIDPLISPLFELCQDMDAKGLHKYISENRRNLATIREEIPTALRHAPNSFHLVLDSLKDFYAVDASMGHGRKDSSLLGMRRTCLMLMESLCVMLEDGKSASGSNTLIITSDVKLRAKTIADEWKSKLADLDIGNTVGNSLEAHAFLQLLATFGIASDFDKDDMCNLIPSVTRRRQTADLCRSLGLTPRIPGLIQALVNSGRQIEAVNLAFVFSLTEQFSPVHLLKTYLKEVKRLCAVKAGNASPSCQNVTTEAELVALRTVIKCIEEHKLEDQYPVDPLQKRILQLQKAKADKKRAAEVAKPHSKRPRANGINYASPSNGCGYGPRVLAVPEKSFYRAPETYPYLYDNNRQYMYPTEARTSPIMGSPSYNASPSHGGYYANGYRYHHQAAYINRLTRH